MLYKSIGATDDKKVVPRLVEMLSKGKLIVHIRFR